jgi:aconitate hydratase
LPTENGFDEDKGFQEPAADGSNVEVTVSETSERLQFLPPWDGKNIVVQNCLSKHSENVLDHISMAGPWLRFRGHLDNIS